MSRFLDEAETYAESVVEIAESQAGADNGSNEATNLERHHHGEDGAGSVEENFGVPQAAHAYSQDSSSNEIPEGMPDLLVGIFMGNNYTSKQNKLIGQLEKKLRTMPSPR